MTGVSAEARVARELQLKLESWSSEWLATTLAGATPESEERSTTWDEIGRNTIKPILLENGFDPVRRKGKSWETFLKAHWGAIAATDFFSVEVITRSGLIRYFVLFVIDLKTRRDEIAGILPRPDGEWMKPIARNLTDY